MDRGAECDESGSQKPIAGRDDRLGRSRPIGPDDPVICVKSGYVDLFWAEIVAGRPSGLRRHVLRAAAGGIVIGMPSAAAADGRSFGALAVAGLDSDSEAVPLDRLLLNEDAAR